MNTFIPTLIGCLIMGLPPILLAYIVFRRQRPIFFFAVALILMGLGYLATTNTPINVARNLMGSRT
jgi:hypothetical protein